MVEAEQDKSYRFSFGKYKGSMLEDVIKQDLSYVYWCVGNVPWFKLPEGTKLPRRPRRIVYIEDDDYWDQDDPYGWGGQEWDW